MEAEDFQVGDIVTRTEQYRYVSGSFGPLGRVTGHRLDLQMSRVVVRWSFNYRGYAPMLEDARGLRRLDEDEVILIQLAYPGARVPELEHEHE